MKELAYLGRLGFHGGKLLARVLMILLPVAGAALGKMLGATAQAGDYANEHPEIQSQEEAWLAFSEGKIGAAEMAYYEEVFPN